MQIYVDSIFLDGQDVSKCISYAADSVGLKELPFYEVTIGDQHDWLKKSQVFFYLSVLFNGNTWLHIAGM